MGGINESSTSLTLRLASPLELSCWQDHEPFAGSKAQALDLLELYRNGLLAAH